MRLIAINSSHRGDHGFTRFMIDLLFKGATQAGAECEVVTLARLKLNRCLGCEKCHTSGREMRCVFDGKDDARQVFADIAAADIVIYATPVYIFNMSSLLKILLERINAICDVKQMQVSESGLFFHHIDRAVCSKPFVSLVCCDNLEDETPKNILEYFKTFSRFMDAPQVGILVRNGAGLAGRGSGAGALADSRRLAQVYAAYEQAGRELAVEGRILRSTQRIANQEILPVPGFHLFKQLRVKAVKAKFIEKAQELQAMDNRAG
jgi:multimeric flavodoxin WrbA